jgi:GT2 family glycosyltransferase
VRVSVVIPATNAPATLERCVAAVEASTEPPDELIVVDSPPHAGPAVARNAGLERATGDVVAFVDSDVLVRPDALARIRARLDEDPALVAVFGAYDDDVPADDLVSGFRNLLHHRVHHRHAGPAGTFWAGLGAVRRESALAVGGFDAARYPRPSIEDIEFGTRLARLGPILLDPAIQGTHLKRWSVRSMVVTDFSRRGVPWVRLMAVEGSATRSLNLGRRERASALAAVAATAALVLRRPRLALVLAVAQVGLNPDLYGVLLRRLGPRGAVSGLVLHTAHQLTAAAALPAGLVAHAWSRLRA